MQEYFAGKVCLVTGAASGLGMQLVRGLLACNAVVYMADADPRALAHVQPEDGPDNIIPVITDVTRAEQVDALVATALKYNGRLDMLFNTAGVSMACPGNTISLDDWHQQMNINLWGVIHGQHYALPVMRRQKRGHIINCSSVAGLRTQPHQRAYCGTKSAVTVIAESLRDHAGDDGITVTTVHPGNGITDMARGDALRQEDTIPADKAARIILKAVSRQDPIVLLPESATNCNEQRRRDSHYYEQVMRDVALARRHYYSCAGLYF